MIDIGVYAPRLRTGTKSAPLQCVAAIVEQLQRHEGATVTLIGHGEFDDHQRSSFDSVDWISVPRIPWRCERQIDDAGLDIVLCYRLTDQIQPRLLSTPTALWYHGDEHWELPEINGRLKSYAVRALEAWRMLQFDHVVCVSEDLRRRVSSRYPGTLSTSAVANGIDHDVFHPVDSLPSIAALDTDRPYVFHVSSFDQKKNPRGVVRSFARLDRDVQLVVCGPGWESNAIVREEIDRLGIGSETLFTGWVEQQTLVQLLSNAAVTVFPSLHETFGLPVLESLACGTPVVASDRYAIPEVAGDGAVLVNPDDPEEIATALDRLLTDEQFRTELARRGREQASNFSWHRATDQMIDVFQRVGSETGVPARNPAPH